MISSSICWCIADDMFWCVYRGWWNWYHGWPIGGAAVRRCLQEKERTTSSRYSATSRAVNLDKICLKICTKLSHLTWFTVFCKFNTHSTRGSFVPSLPLCLCFCRHTTTDLFVFPLSVPSVAWLKRLWVVAVFSGHGYRGAKLIPPMVGTTTNEERGCPGWVWAAGYLWKGTTGGVWLWDWKM